MSTRTDRWKRFAESKEYREEYVAAQVKRAIPFQIRAMLKQREISQEELAHNAGLTQGVVSRAANPEYGNLTLNTIVRIAAGFDVAFIGEFVPFSKLDRYFSNLSEDEIGNVPSFGRENEHIERHDATNVTVNATARSESAAVNSDALGTVALPNAINRLPSRAKPAKAHLHIPDQPAGAALALSASHLENSDQRFIAGLQSQG